MTKTALSAPQDIQVVGWVTGPMTLVTLLPHIQGIARENMYRLPARATLTANSKN
jgi:hypothetical protein